jgi:H+/Cl- antiporter ClcA
VWELGLFIMVGSLGGLIGAIFNGSNEHLSKWRMKRVQTLYSRGEGC